MIQKNDYKFSIVAMSEKVSEIGSGSGEAEATDMYEVLRLGKRWWLIS